MLIKIAEFKPGRYGFFFKKNWKKKRQKNNTWVHICWLPPPCYGSMKEAGVWKEQLLSSQNGRADLERSVPVTEIQEKVQNLLALSSFVWDDVQFQTHPEISIAVITEKVSESPCLTVQHVTYSSRDLMFIYCVEQHQLPKCISPIGARVSSDTVPVPVRVLNMQNQ